jgi:hypothetical protein
MGNDIITEIRAIVADCNTAVPQKTYNRLMLAAISQLYDKVDALSPALTTYKILVWVVAGVVVAAMTAAFTGHMHLLFTP